MEKKYKVQGVRIHDQDIWSEQFKKSIARRIRIERPRFKTDQYESTVSGRRFKDDISVMDRVLSAVYDFHLREGDILIQDASIIEVNALEHLKEIVIDSLLDCARADYYYANEKQWD